MKFLLIAALAFLAASQAKEIGFRNFDGFQVLTVEVSTPEQSAVLKKLYDDDQHDFWSSPRKIGATDIMGNAQQVKEMIQLFNENGMKYSVKVEDVQSLVENERRENKAARAGKEGRIDWTSYATYQEVEDWLLSIKADHVTVSKIGESFQGRNLYVVKFSSGGPSKKSIIIDGNIHAREWIAGATATWMINELHTGDYSDLLEDLDIYIIPFLNPDGYEWSRTSDRLWRKTRSVNSGSACIGCDPNRNFGFQFAGEGTSPNPCSDTYHGGVAFSQPETTALKEFVEGHEAQGVQFLAYITLHSYSQVWLLPWGYTAGVYPPDYPEQLSVGQASIRALRDVHNTIYDVGQGADLLYGVGGASDDWAKDHGIKYTTTVEMRDTGRYGFVLPPAQIIPNAEEVWAGVNEYFKRVRAMP